MIGWPENAYTGQRVVCVSNVPHPKYGKVKLKLNEIYTIHEIYIAPNGDLGFRLREIRSPAPRHKDGSESGFNAKRFRPVQTRDTSAQVEALKRLTLGVRA